MSAKALRQLIDSALHRGGPGGVHDWTDGLLLRRFVTDHDQSAFETLVSRHGPMVLRVCRRVLGNVQDAEDAFQAAFIVLARKAGTMTECDSIAGWLYQVACRVALNARKLRGRRETASARWRERVQPTEAVSAAPTGTDDVRAVLDDEVSRLPEKYRLPVLLCYLQGRTNDEAAQQLGWPRGTVATRLAHARELLQGRLTRRGLSLGSATLAALFAQEAAAAVPPGTNVALARAALTMIRDPGAVAFSPAACRLADAWGRAALISKMRRGSFVALLVLLAVGMALAGIVPRPHADEQAGSKSSVGPVERPAAAPPTELFRVGAFAADNRALALADALGAVQIFDIEFHEAPRALNYTLRHRLDEPGQRGSHLAFAPDGRTVAVGYVDGSVRLWSPTTGKKLATLPPVQSDQVLETVFAPDSQSLTVSIHKVGLTTWDLATGKIRSHVPLPDIFATHLAHTPAGELMMIHQHDYRVRCFDAATGQEKPVAMPALTGKSAGVPYRAVAMSTHGLHLVLLAADGRVHLWNRAAKSVQPLFRLEKDAGNVCFMASPQGDTVACVFLKTNKLAIWEVARARELYGEEKYRGGLTCLAYARDGARVFLSGLLEPARAGQKVTLTGCIVDLNERRRLLESPKSP